MALVAIAGPLSNLILALLAVVLLMILSADGSSLFALLSASADTPALELLARILQASVFVNIGLMAFNLLPLPPLDGSNVLQMFIPWRYEQHYADLRRVGPFILLFLVFF